RAARGPGLAGRVAADRRAPPGRRIRPRPRRRPGGQVERPGIPERSAMTASGAFEAARQTAWILLPEIILLLTAMGMMTASAFVRQPRRRWCRIGVWALLAAL